MVIGIEAKYSKLLSWITYNTKTSSLDVEFKSGSKYRYRGVTLQKFYRFRKAKSKGSYFARYVKGKYETLKVK